MIKYQSYIEHQTVCFGELLFKFNLNIKKFFFLVSSSFLFEKIIMNKVIVHMSSYFDYDLNKIFDLCDLCSTIYILKKVKLEFFSFLNYNSNVTF